MTKNEVYNALLEKVQQAGGYMVTPKKRIPSFKTNEGFVIGVAAIYESADDSSPLKVIDTQFHSYDLEDYINAEDMEYLFNQL